MATASPSVPVCVLCGLRHAWRADCVCATCHARRLARCRAPSEPGWYWRHPTGLRKDADRPFYAVRVESFGPDLVRLDVSETHGGGKLVRYEPVADDGLWFGPAHLPSVELLRE